MINRLLNQIQNFIFHILSYHLLEAQLVVAFRACVVERVQSHGLLDLVRGALRLEFSIAEYFLVIKPEVDGYVSIVGSNLVEPLERNVQAIALLQCQFVVF